MAENKNKVETEEEMKKRLKEEIMAELMAELKEEKKDSSKKEITEEEEIIEETKKEEEKKPRVSFESYNDKGLKEVNELNKKDRVKVEKKEFKKFNLPKAPEDDGKNNNLSLIIVFIALVAVAVIIFFFPDIYKLINRGTPSTTKDPDIVDDNPTEKLEKITLNSEILTKFNYPIMRNSKYSTNTYYKSESITMSKFNNNDILYNAFIHIYKGNIAEYTEGYTGQYCGTAETKKTFNAKYIDARIANLFTKSTDYKHADFTVPSTNTDTTYTGTWKYDSKNNRYIYYGNCNNNNATGDSVYYDLKVAYKAEGLSKNTVIEVSYYMGFAKVDLNTKNYTIYSDVEMTTALSSGILVTANYETELNNIFSTYIETNTNLNKYKYTFSSNDCSYKDYCFEKGEWIK